MDRSPLGWVAPIDFRKSPIENAIDRTESPIQRQNMTLRMMLQMATIKTSGSGKRALVAFAERKLRNRASTGGRMTIGHKANVHINAERFFNHSLICPDRYLVSFF